MDWKDYVKNTIDSYRKKFRATKPELRALLKSDFDATLLAPCQVEVCDLGEPWVVIWTITHDQHRKDMEITINEKARSPETYIKKFLEMSPHWKTYTQETRTNILGCSREGGILYLYPSDYLWYSQNLKELEPSEHAAELIRLQKSLIMDELERIQHKKIEESAEVLKKDIALVTEEGLRYRLEETSKKIDEAVLQLRRIEEHEDKLKSMEDQMIGVRKLPLYNRSFILRTLLGRFYTTTELTNYQRVDMSRR